jgi:hypothetical protein
MARSDKNAFRPREFVVIRCNVFHLHKRTVNVICYTMDKTFGTLVRQLRLQQGYSLRELARRIDVSPNFLSKMELGHFPPPGEQKIILIA